MAPSSDPLQKRAPDQHLLDSAFDEPAGGAVESHAARSAAIDIAGDDFDRNVWNVFGLAIDAVDRAGAVASLETAVRVGRKRALVTPNVNMLCAALRSETARAHINAHDLSVVDGAPLALIARLMGVPVKERVAGSDVFEALRRRPTAPGRPMRVFFFGGREGAAEAACAALNADRGALRGVGYLNPGFGDIEAMSAPEIIAEINAAAPDVVVVALGAEKGNAWIARNAGSLSAPVVSHLGAVVDFTAGTIRRAPVLWRRLGMEWLWRIRQEPALWRRYWRDGLSLLGVCIGRLAPLMLKPLKPVGLAAAAHIEVRQLERGEQSRECIIVRLSGDLRADDLSPVRAAFRAAASLAAKTADRRAADPNRADLDVVLDFTDVGAVDAAFLGLVLMLEKHVAAAGATLSRSAASKSLARQLWFSGVRLDSQPEVPRIAPSVPKQPAYVPRNGSARALEAGAEADIA